MLQVYNVFEEFDMLFFMPIINSYYKIYLLYEGQSNFLCVPPPT